MQFNNRFNSAALLLALASGGAFVPSAVFAQTAPVVNTTEQKADGNGKNGINADLSEKVCKGGVRSDVTQQKDQAQCQDQWQSSTQNMSPEQRQKLSNWMQANPSATADATQKFASSIGITLANDTASWASANNSQALKVLNSNGGSPVSIDQRDQSITRIEAPRIPAGSVLMPAPTSAGQAMTEIVLQDSCSGNTVRLLTKHGQKSSGGVNVTIPVFGGGFGFGQKVKSEDLTPEQKVAQQAGLSSIGATVYGNIDAYKSRLATKRHALKVGGIFSGNKTLEEFSATAEFSDGTSGCLPSTPPVTPPPVVIVPEPVKACILNPLKKTKADPRFVFKSFLPGSVDPRTFVDPSNCNEEPIPQYGANPTTALVSAA